MQLVSVNVGAARTLDIEGRAGRTGIFKEPTAGPVRVTALGLEGDAICDTRFHGGEDQAVYVFGREDYAWWEGALGRALAPGTFGENLTIAGLDSAAARIGDRFRIGAGGVLLEVTLPRIPCATLAARMGDPDFVARFQQAERPGLYCRVLQPGRVCAGDPVTHEPYLGDTVTTTEVFRRFSHPEPDVAFLRRFVAAPSAVRARVYWEQWLQRHAA